MRYLLDTDWAVWWLRGRKEFVEAVQGTAERRASHQRCYAGRACHWSPSVPESPATGEGSSSLPPARKVLPFTDDIAYRFGELNARLMTTGSAIDSFDLAIATTALHHGLTLLSENRKHYERIPGLKLESLKTHP